MCIQQLNFKKINILDNDILEAYKASSNAEAERYMENSRKRDKYDLEGRIEDFTKANELDPSYSLAYYGRSLSYFGKSQKEESLNDMIKARDLGFPYAQSFLDETLRYGESQVIKVAEKSGVFNMVRRLFGKT
jgi:hypothetical protein